MLKHFSVKNYALIDSLELDWDSNFTAITGETGAGKSILLGALGLIVGDRADTSIARNKAEKVIIEASFEAKNDAFKKFFKEQDLDIEEISLVRRELSPSGKSRAFVNDTPVKLNVLKSLGQLLVDIHGQHQTLLLRDDRFQLKVLDHFAGLQLDLEEYTSLFKKYKEVKHTLDKLREQEVKQRQEQDFIQFQFEELNQARLESQDISALEEEQQTLEHAEEIKRELFESQYLLSEADSNVVGILKQVELNLSRISKFSSAVSELAERVSSALIEIGDVDHELQSISEEVQVNPERQEQITGQLDELNKLLSKHRCSTILELIEIRDSLENSLSSFESIGEDIINLQKKLTQLESDLEEKCKILSKKRKSSVSSFIDEIHSILVDLGMSKSIFEVDFSSLESFGESGKDEVTFMFSANSGIEPGPLHKVASGGEMSRCMLALKTVLSSKTSLPAIIFDEIDTGVSGKVASKLAKLLKRLSAGMQVICITHLPQVAGQADDHLRVEKKEENGLTASSLVRLDKNQRIEELAHMLSGEKLTDAAVENARELLVSN